MHLHKLKTPFIRLPSSCYLYAHITGDEETHLLSASFFIIRKKHATPCCCTLQPPTGYTRIRRHTAHFIIDGKKQQKKQQQQTSFKLKKVHAVNNIQTTPDGKGHNFLDHFVGNSERKKKKKRENSRSSSHDISQKAQTFLGQSTRTMQAKVTWLTTRHCASKKCAFCF